LNNQLTVLISDTVGFINKLPHHLIASFQSTLAQAREAEVLLHIVDLSNQFYEDHIKTVEKILQILGIDNKPTFIIFNKVDKVSDENILKIAGRDYPKALFVSARKKIRIQNIIDTIKQISDIKIPT
jgi:GTP-binding protein HflX